MASDKTKFPQVHPIEPCPILDTFCTEMARAEVLGPNVRLSFSVAKKSFPYQGIEPKTEHELVARVIIPRDYIRHLVRQLQAVVGEADCTSLSEYIPEEATFN